jgi:transposase
MKKEEVTKLKNDLPLGRERRFFSETARKLIVKEIDHGLSKAEASRKYKVSQMSIYKWIVKYSEHYKATFKTVVEHESDSIKLKKLEAELERTYAILGREKAENLLLTTVIEKADEAMGTDLKKNLDTLRLQNFTTKKETIK